MKKRGLPFWLPHSKKALIWYILFIAIFILYHDFWSWSSHQPLIRGWLPGWFLYDALLIIAYVVVAAAFARFYWPKPPKKSHRK